MTYTSALEPWRYCGICRIENTQPFSAERVYKAHLKTQKHLTKLSRPPPAYPCPVCNTTFSRAADVARHQTNPGQCHFRQVPTELTSQLARKHPLNVDSDEVPQKHRKTDNQETLGVYIAPHPARIAIEQMVGKSGTTAKSSDSPSLLPSSSSVQEQNMFHDCKETDDFSEHRSRQQNSLAGHEIPHARLERAHKDFQKTVAWYSGPYDKGKGFFDLPEDITTAISGQSIDCVGEDSDKHISVASYGSNTHSALNIIPRRTVHSNPEKAEDHAMKQLSVAMSSASIRDVTSQAAISQPGTLSSMSSIYGPRPLYHAKILGSSQHTESSLPEMQTFDITVDRKPPRDSAEVPKVLDPRSLEPNWEDALEHAMIENISYVPNLLSNIHRDLDINHRSSISNGETPLMAAIRRNYYDVVRKLLTDSVVTRNWPRLSARDNDANTAIELAAANGTEHLYARLVECITAILCCECPDPTRRGSVCERIVHKLPSDRYALVLEEGPLRYPFRAGCRWGEKLLQRGWLNIITLGEIDARMRDRMYWSFDNPHEARNMSELAGLSSSLDEWSLVNSDGINYGLELRRGARH